MVNIETIMLWCLWVVVKIRVKGLGFRVGYPKY